MRMLSIVPHVLDGALAVVVDDSTGAVAVWKGRSRIEIHDLAGSWQETVSPYPAGQPGLWTRQEVLAYAGDALCSLAPPKGPRSMSRAEEGILVAVEDLQRAWLLRAKSSGYALWDGGDTVDVYTADGTHLRAVRV